PCRERPLWRSAENRAANWLLDKEVTRRGDWAEYTSAAPAGWFFEYHNEFYPDVDDTAMVMIALAASGRRKPAEEIGDRGQRSEIRCQIRVVASACHRARQWMLAMQNRD